jgi:hypothetical protein
MRRILRDELGPRLEGIAPTNGHVPVTWQTAEEISELIQLRETAVQLLPEGQVRHSIQTEIVQLRRRAEMARMKAAGASVTANAGNKSVTH